MKFFDARGRDVTAAVHAYIETFKDGGHSFEVHINVPLTAGPARIELDELARSGRFKLSDMDGHEHGEKRETILTTHGQDYVETQQRTLDMCLALHKAGYELIRYKIEHVIVDSRVKDIWGLFP